MKPAWREGRTVFCKYLFGEAIETLPRIFYYLRTAKYFLMIVPFMYNFESFSTTSKLPTIF